MLLQKKIKEEIQIILKSEFPELTEENLKAIQVDASKSSSYGDFSTTCSLAFAKVLKKAPILIANQIKNNLEEKLSDIYSIEVAPPGFVNFTLTNKGFNELVKSLNKDELIEKNTDKAPILIEYVSANPTGDLHMGHGRGAVVGSALASIVKATGRQVGTEFYINDAGEQIQKLGQTAWSLYSKEPSQSDQYPPELVEPYTKDLKEGLSFDELTELVKNKILEKQKKVLSSLKVNFDRWISEKNDLHNNGKLTGALNKLKEANLTYSKDEALWFKSTDLGDERDRVLVKSDGRATYLAGDIAYHLNKFERYEEALNLWGADHQGQEVSMQVALKALGNNPDKFQILFIQFVSLVENGQELKMSKRQGTLITIEEVLEKVGPDAFRFFLLLSHVNNRLAFDLDLALRTDDQNPVFYVQYAHARACSILRNATTSQVDGEEAICSIDEIDNAVESEEIFNKCFDEKLSEQEIQATKNLILKLSFFNDEIQRSADNLNPSGVAHYLIDLANLFHSFYSHCRVLDYENKTLTLARLSLIRAFQRILKTGLETLLITAPERM
ncbi:MAG: arginine--tRNA ligase [Candidatus Caenarcaniphilales bacterium]|nr:arginine--tRNA ligase [Candidatus Caenarcaniphilales bacterium]